MAKNAQADLWKLLHRLDGWNGWSVRKSGSGKWRIAGPNGVLMFCPTSPSDWRGLPNLTAHLRREGVSETVLTGRQVRRNRKATK
jgi:hypothetical protein